MEALIRASPDNDAWIVGNCISNGAADMFIGSYYGQNMYASSYASGVRTAARSSSLTGWTRISELASSTNTIFRENGTTMTTINWATPDGRYLELAAIHQKTLYVDWIGVRKYTQNEPTHGAWSG